MSIKETVSAAQRITVVGNTWRRTLEAIPTLLGRLAYLTSLRTGEAGRYQHYGIAQRLGEDETHEFLSGSHTENFRLWLAMELEPQKRDLEQYLFETGNPLSGGMQEEGARALASWIALETWAVWVPAASRDVERELYRNDMSILLELLRREVGVDRRDPDL